MRRSGDASKPSGEGLEELSADATVSVRRNPRILFVLALLTVLGVGAYINTEQFMLPNSKQAIRTAHSLASSYNAEDNTVKMAVNKLPGETAASEATEMQIASATEDTQNLTQLTGASKPFAYMFYITKDIYACAALHLITQLVQNLHMNTSAIDIVVLHSNTLSQTMQTQLQQHLPVRLVKVDPINADATEPTWKESLTKLLVFRDWGYDRVVYLDADSVPMQNLDHLFALPPAPLYAPIAYWLPQPFFSSALMVIEPSTSRFEAMIKWARSQGAAAGFDMDIVNSYFKDTVQYLPGDYTVLNSDFRAKPDAKNSLYATTTELKKHVKLIHFSCKPDGSYGKPWTSESRDVSFVASQGLDPLFADLFVGFWATQDNRCS